MTSLKLRELVDKGKSLYVDVSMRLPLALQTIQEELKVRRPRHRVQVGVRLCRSCRKEIECAVSYI